MTQNIYIVHFTANKRHYLALEHLSKKHNYKLIFLNLNFIKLMIKNILRTDLYGVISQVKIGLQLMSLMLFKNQRILFGIPPFSPVILYAKILSYKNTIYYHTSWPYWDSVSNVPSKPLLINFFLRKWSKVISFDFKTIFVVNKFVMNAIQHTFNINKNKLSIVQHSISSNFYFPKNSTNHEDHKISFLYCGRLEENKGVLLLLDFFKNSDLVISFVGSGKLADKIKSYKARYDNINYLGHFNDQLKLGETYRNHDYLLLPSQKTKTWEELFGIVIIEAMGCGTVPIASNHVGPRGIIEHNKDGYLLNDNKFIDGLTNIIKSHNHASYCKLSAAAIKKSRNYFTEEISNNWINLIKD